MSQQGRNHGKDQDRHHARAGSEHSAAPQEHHPASEPEERQVSGSRQGQAAIIVARAAAIQNGVAFDGHVALLVAVHSGQVGRQRHHDAGQRGMLGFVVINALIEPLHSACDVRGFVGGVVEHRVGERDADGSEQDQPDNHRDGTPLQEIFYSRENRRLGLQLRLGLGRGSLLLSRLLLGDGRHSPPMIKEIRGRDECGAAARRGATASSATH
jgi:hypothetical protein